MAEGVRHVLKRAVQYVRSHRVLVGLTTVFFLFSLVRYLRKVGDFEVYYAAGWRFLNGFSVHAHEPNIFSYPTAAAVFFAPLAAVGYDVAKTGFYLLGFFFLLLGIRLTNEMLLPSEDGDPKVRRLVFIASLACTGRYFLAVFDNQQTDLFIFGLVTLGIYNYTAGRRGAAICWAVPVLLKANPAFMILLPVFQRQFRVAVILLLVVLAGVLAPDLVKPGPGSGDRLTLPAHVLPKDGVIGEKTFNHSPLPNNGTAYIDEYLSMTLAGDGPSWWEDRTNPKNQSLTRILLYYLPAGMDGKVVFLALCLAFSMALFLLARRTTGGEGLVFTGLLFYGAFVLIGPVSSKPHFVMLYGLFACAWLDLLRNFSAWKLTLVAGAGVVVGFTSSGFLTDLSDRLATWGHIGLASLALWVYVYLLALRTPRVADS